MEILDLLDRSSFLQGVSEKSKKALAAICAPKKFRKKETLFLEGEKGQAIYLVAEGTIQLYKSSPEGKEIVIRVVPPGEIFAEVILFEQDHYPVSAVAVEKSLVYSLPKTAFRDLLEAPSFRDDFIAMLMKKQRYLAGRILNLTTHDVEERFFQFLLERYGRKETYRITLSKKDLAAAVGTIPETLSRLLLRLKKDGAALWENDVLTLRKGFWQDRGIDMEEEF
jgi:CRP/FNR family transcriptional regulator